MKPSRYVLTGMRKYRKAAHSPVFLNWHVSQAHNMDGAYNDFPQYENFTLFSISEGVFRKLQNRGFFWEHKIDDFASLPSYGGKNRIMLCTEAEFFFAQAKKLITVRGAVAVHWIGRRFRQALRPPQP